MINRLCQENCETFVITGNKVSDESLCKGILETYNYEYDSEQIPFIIESTKVDVVVFSGAFDSRFTWKTQGDAVSFISGLYNMLISASRAGVKRFIYLSTTELYQRPEEGLIREASPLKPVGIRLMTIHNGEEIALRYHQLNDMQVVILRCSEIYGLIYGRTNEYSFCTRLSEELLSGSKIEINQKEKHDNIHISDVVELVYQAIYREKPFPHNVYNICSGIGVTEKLIYWMIAQVLGLEDVVWQAEDTISDRYEYSNELAVKELDFEPKYSFEDGILQLIRQQQEHTKLQAKKKGGERFKHFRRNVGEILGWLFPYIETAAVFFIVQLIIKLFGHAQSLAVIDFYLMYVVLIAIIYGKGHTITALLLSLSGRIYSTEQYTSFKEIAIDYNIYLWLLQLLIIGMGIGFVRDNYKQQIEDNEEEIRYLKAELMEIKEINTSNVRIKQIYENRLVNYKDSFAKIYSIVSKLSDLEPDKIMFEAVGVVAQIMKSNEIAIYSVDKSRNYARLAASSVYNGYRIDKSIDLNATGEIGECIKNRKIYVNRTLDRDKPSMAGGVYHEEVLTNIVLIRDLPFEMTTLYHMNLFSVVLNLIAQALSNANHFIEENHSNRYITGTNILTQKAFFNMVEIKKNGSDIQLADYYILEIVQGDKSLRQLSEIITPALRQKDYMGLDESNRLYLLLSNTNESESQFVKERLFSKGIEIRRGELGGYGA